MVVFEPLRRAWISLGVYTVDLVVSALLASGRPFCIFSNARGSLSPCCSFRGGGAISDGREQQRFVAEHSALRAVAYISKLANTSKSPGPTSGIALYFCYNLAVVRPSLRYLILILKIRSGR